MEVTDALEEFSGSNDHSIVIKGKRTKRRQRPLSPVGRAAVVTSSSSSGGGGGDDQGGERDGEVLGYIYSLIPSCNTSTSDVSLSTIGTDQEDEDMANCLILLAQGESCRKQVDQDHESKMEKFTSRRFNEMVTTTTGGKVGLFVYECKTCNRTFPSFQALGGHRASHKKPKINIEDNKAIIATLSNDHHHHHREEEDEEEGEKESGEEHAAGQLISRQSPPLSIQSTNKPCSTAAGNRASKSHECSICGAEFASGQALGGHMRRHRNSMTASTSKVAMILETSPRVDYHNDSSSHDHLDQKPRNIFPLDLNLPAPSEDDVHRDLKFQFSANQQPHLVFSAPALVDCHY